ncbi:MAG: hypothetical protein RLY58_1597 [Pseudomonadota bacterium]
MKVFKSEAEKSMAIVFVVLLGMWSSDLLFSVMGSEKPTYWMAVLLPIGFFLLLYIVISFIMPRVVLNSNEIQLRVFWGLILIKTIPYQDIQKISTQTIGANLQILVDLKNNKRHIIQGFKPDKAQDILEAIQPYVQIDRQPIKVEIPLGLGDDVGKSVLVIVALSIALGIVDLCMSYFHQAWHSSSENMFHWLLISIPLAILLVYPYIKAEKKSNPLVSSIVVGLLFGAALNFLFLQSLRWWNEQHPIATQMLNFKLIEKEAQRQKWQPVQSNSLSFHDGYVWVHDVWKAGFNPKLEQGKTYQIAVVQGRLNDIYFPINAFIDAKQIDPDQRIDLSSRP